MDLGPEKIEVRELEPLSFEEAKALVLLLALAPPNEPFAPSQQGIGYAGRNASPLQKLFASLPPAQRQTFMATMDHVWPRPQRNGQKYPRGVDGLQQQYGHHRISDWNDAWAAAFSAASHVGETAMSIAMRRAQGAKGRWRKS